MEFCPKCGSVLIQKRKNDGCVRCGYSAKGTTKIKTSEHIQEKDKKKEIAVMKKGETTTCPIIAASCTKCGNNQAYFWSVQMRAADEAEVRFFKCTKCSHTWRERR